MAVATIDADLGADPLTCLSLKGLRRGDRFPAVSAEAKVGQTALGDLDAEDYFAVG
jgi:hypothetical protein